MSFSAPWTTRSRIAGIAEHADFLAAVLRDLLLPVRHGNVLTRDQFVPDLLEKAVHSALLDGREGDPVDTRGSVVLLGHRGRLRGASPSCRRGRTGPRNATTVPPSPWRRSSVSGPADRSSGLCHPAPASLSSKEHVQQGPFAPRALPRFLATIGPLRLPLAFGRLPGSPVVRPTFLRRFRDGARRVSPVDSARPCHRAAAATPPEGHRRNQMRTVLLPSPSVDGLGLRSFLFSRLHRAFTFVAAR